MRLGFFPALYKDELLYSGCARYFGRLGVVGGKHNGAPKFGVDGPSSAFDFPIRLNLFCKSLPEGSLLSVEKIIEEHTLFPLLEATLSNDRVIAVKKIMQEGGPGPNIKSISGLVRPVHGGIDYLRYCHECVEKDRRDYGEPYWHRSHQVPGVFVCHIHGICLTNSDVKIGKNKSVNFITLSMAGTTSCLIVKKNYFEIAKEFADEIHAILNINGYANVSRDNAERSKKNIYHYFSSFSFKKNKNCTKGFIDFYSKEFLQLIKCTVPMRYNHNWIIKSIVSKRRIYTPLCNFLITYYAKHLFKKFSLEQILRTSLEPFGKPPYPCQNPACSHYLIPVIAEAKIGRDRNGRPSGRFSCKCGFIFSRSMIGFPEGNRCGPIKVLRYGMVWEAKLLELKRSGHTFREIASILKASDGCIGKYFKKLSGAESRHKVVSVPAAKAGDSAEESRKSRAISEMLKQFPTEEACRRFFESIIWPSVRTCPYCGGTESREIRCQTACDGLYRCKGCDKHYTVTTRTPLHGTKLPMWRWLLALYWMLNSRMSISTNSLAKCIDVSRLTAKRMAHAIQTLMNSVPAEATDLLRVGHLDEESPSCPSVSS